MNYVCNFYYKEIQKDNSLSKLKHLNFLSFDNNPCFSIQYYLKKENPKDIVISNSFKGYETSKPVYVFDISLLSDIEDENELKILKQILNNYQIDLKKKGTNDLIFNHIMFMTYIYETYCRSRINFQVESIQTKEEINKIILENVDLLDIFDNIKTWLSVPFVRFRTQNDVFVKQFNNLITYLEEYEDGQYIGVTEVLEEKISSYRKYDEIEIFQLIVDKENHFKKKLKTQSKLCLKKVISIKDFQKENKDELYMEVILNNKCIMMSTVDQVLHFLKIKNENIVNKSEVSFIGKCSVPIDSLPIEEFLPCKNRTESGKCEKCFQSIEKYNYETYNYYEKKTIGNFCLNCYRNYHIEYNFQRIVNMTHFDSLIQYFFQYPNFSQIDNDESISLIFKTLQNKYYASHMCVRINIYKNNSIEFIVKKSSGKKQFQMFLEFFFSILLKIQNRKYYYFNNYNTIQSNGKIFYRSNEIQDIFVIHSRQFDENLFQYDPKNSFNRITHTDDMEEEHSLLQCKEILKHFLYTRYCDRKRMPYISFEKPDSNIYNFIQWPPLENFTKDNNFTIHMKSPKYKTPIKIIWNQQSSFVMIIKNDMDTSNVKTIIQEKIIEFSNIYFFIEKNSKKYLSVTNLSPGFLPSLTIKKKYIEDTSIYMSKKRKLDKDLNNFFNSHYNDPEVTFYMDRKYPLSDLITMMNSNNKYTTNLSLREQIYFNVFDDRIYTDIKYVYHYLCHKLESNIIIFENKNKNNLMNFKPICSERSWCFKFFNRFLFLIENMDDKNGTIVYFYQPVCFEKHGKFQYFFDKSNPMFFSDTISIYRNVILNQDHIFHYKKLKNFIENVKSQTVDCFGNTKFLHFIDGTVGFILSENIPLFEKHIQYNFDQKSILKMDLDDLKACLKKNIPYNLEFDQLYHLQENFYIYLVNISLQKDITLKIGFISRFENAISCESLDHQLKKEIFYYAKADFLIKNKLSVYKNSFVKNNLIKRKILESFLRFLRKKKNNEINDIVNEFISEFIHFTTNIDFIFKWSKKIHTPLCYQENLPYYLKWFASISNKKIFLQKLKIKSLYTFDLKNHENTFIDKYNS